MKRADVQRQLDQCALDALAAAYRNILMLHLAGDNPDAQRAAADFDRAFDINMAAHALALKLVKARKDLED